MNRKDFLETIVGAILASAVDVAGFTAETPSVAKINPLWLEAEFEEIYYYSHPPPWISLTPLGCTCESADI